MKLSFLSILVAMGVSTTAIPSTVSFLETNKNPNLNFNQDVYQSWVASKDSIKYDLTGSQVKSFALPDLLTLFNELNNIRLENKGHMFVYGIPTWGFTNDQDQAIGFGYITGNNNRNLNALLNSSLQDISFDATTIILSPYTEPEFIVNLDYTIAGVAQTMTLFSLKTAKIPLQQENMKVIFELNYEIK